MRFRRKKESKRVTDSWPISPNGMDTTYGEMRYHAQNIADKDWTTPAEKGLALSILALLDDAERRSQ